MATVGTVEAWVRAQAKNYDQDCAGFTYTLARLFGTAIKVYGSAKIAYGASTINGTDMNSAPAGAVGYWQVAEPNWHVMVSLGDGLWLGATTHLTTFWGVNTGTVSSADYIRLSGAVRSKGWSLKYGVNSISITNTSLASTGDATPVPKPTNYALYEGAGMLIMNRTQDNVIAVFDESHWQEIHYLANSTGALGVTTDYVTGLAHSLPVVPYDATGWDYRSNRAPTIKQPLFALNADGSLSTLKTAISTSAPATTVNLAASDRAVLDAIAAKSFPTKVTSTLS